MNIKLNGNGNLKHGRNLNMNWLPSSFTATNLGAGCTSLLFTIQGYYRMALLMILVAAMCDVLDGLIARMLHCTSEFGKQLDSLADIVSFGAAPAMLILMHKLEHVHLLGAAATVVFLVCGALRLARFNISAPCKGFIGLPITAAGLLLAMLSLNQGLQPGYLLLLMVLLSFLMVSRIPFPSLTK
jgi:CDP-diacylglycerol--serine O-phosphatidyltransferase